MNPIQTHYIGLGNTLTPLGFVLIRNGAPRDLTDLPVRAIGYKANKTVWFEEREEGVNVTVPENGVGTLDLQPDDVTTAGTFYVFLHVYDEDEEEFDSYPHDGLKMRVVISIG